MKMKKNNLLILAVAALGFAACANDETTAVNEKLAESNAISFRTSVAGNMRAALLTTSNLTSFSVIAKTNQTETTFFDWDTFTKGTDGFFVSNNKHYWPSSTALDFYAYAPVSPTNGTITPSSYKAFEVETASTAETQFDFIYAASKNKSKSTHSGGVNLNFRHACSQIVIKVVNSSANLKFNITDCKIANIKANGTFTAPIDYSDNSSNTESGTGTGGSASTFSGAWSPISNPSTFKSTASKDVAASAVASVYGDDDQAFVLIPQAVTPATAYSVAGGKSTDAYIALKMKIRNNDNLGDNGTGSGDGTLIADATADNQWAMWPIPSITWLPGYKYTYTIDLAGGGFKETDDPTVNPGTLIPDPILAGAEIKFLTVTVDTWETRDITIPTSNYAFEASSTKSLGTGIAAGTTGDYSIKVSGLTEDKAASVATTGDFTASVSPLTVPADGIVTINATLSNATAATDNSITLTVADMGTMTFTLTRVAP